MHVDKKEKNIMNEIIRPPVKHQPKLFLKLDAYGVFDQSDNRGVCL